MMIEFEAVIFMLGCAALMAGYVDAVVGGGGLIQTPALLAAFPNTGVATLFGTNKVASIVGTTSAAIQYARRVKVPWGIAVPGAMAALIGAWLGARTVAYLPTDLVRPVIFVLLILVAMYTFSRKDFGAVQGREVYSRGDRGFAVAIGLAIGFYDGFFGPGTGSFFIFLMVRFLAMDFLRASVTAKIMNVATNLAAIGFFSMNVEILWLTAAVMAGCNLIGAVIGSRMAIRHGAGFVRKMFLGVVSMLIVKMGYDLFM